MKTAETRTPRTTGRQAMLNIDGRVFTVDATTVRRYRNTPRTRYLVCWNGGWARGNFAAICERVTAEFGQPCATRLLGEMLAKLAPVGVQIVQALVQGDRSVLL